MSVEEYNYWLETKSAYENNLKNNIGHLESIKVLISKIDKKLSSAVVRFWVCNFSILKVKLLMKF